MQSLIKRWFLRLGMPVALFLSSAISKAQCDYINNITGLSLAVFPTGNAADPALYTQTYVLVNNEGNIVRTGVSPNFMAVPAGLYNVYAVNYNNNETAAVLPLLAIGQPWSGVAAYGDNTSNCLDYTAPYSNCWLSVCQVTPVCEFFTLTLNSNSYETNNHTQSYVLVCGGTIQAINATGTFDLNAYGAAVPGTNTCQVFAVNYLTGSTPAGLAVGGAWATVATAACSGCLDYLGMSLNVLPVSQSSGNGVSTPVDWTDNQGCAGAQAGTNAGAPFSVTVNNWCTPGFGGPINARPDEVDDLIRLMGPESGGEFNGRVPCTGTMDLTQNPIFYTVECDPTQPSTLIVDIPLINTSGTITRIEAALYGPVDPLCPVITGGSFIDCDDSGAGSQSGEPLSDLQLTASAQPGQVFLVIVDTEGREQFIIQSQVILLNSALLDFTGKKEGAVNVLEWATSKEDGSDHFVLERSEEGLFFEALGTVPAAGYSNQEVRYAFTDAQPGEGTKYYRLHFVKQDGSGEYSKIVALTREQITPTVSVYPNPTRGSFTVEFSLAAATSARYTLTDVLGRTLLQNREQTVLEGLNKLEIDLGNVPSACYFLSLDLGSYRINKRIIKQ